MYTLHANDCLIQNSRANHSRHNYDFKYPYCNGNVILNCRAENSRYSSDFHMYLSMSNLLDHTMVNGDYLESVFRPYGGPIHGHSSTQSVFYNTVGEKYHPSKDYIVESRQYKNGYIIGTSGPAYQVKTDPVSGTQGGYAYDSSPRDFVEGVGQGIDLRPVSLYLDQLDRRLKDSVVYPGYALSLVVLNKESGDPVQGAEIRIYNEVGLTDSSGMVSFSEVPESFFLEVSHIQYSSLPLQQVLIFSDTTLSLKMEENTYKLNFEVLDESTLNPVRGVSVSLNENVDVTDNEGKVSFDTYTGTASYNIEKSAYKPVSGTVLIKNDTTLLFLLERSHADVKIRLREGSTPVNNVWVRLEGDSILSDGLGLAKFLQLPVRQEYNYSTFREGYVDQSGLLYLRTDTTIDVAMEKLSSAVEIMGSNESFKIWPNPTTGTLHFEMTGVELSVLSIYDARGAKVLETKVSGNSETIELDKLPSGMYTVKLEGAPPSLIIKL